MEIEKLNVFRESMELGEIIWTCVILFDPLSRNTLGYQVIRSADSVAANISEGEGSFYFGDKKRFLYYARSSLFETKTWVQKMRNRDLIDNDKFIYINNKLENIKRLINGTLNSISKK